jgi:6-pyruvoyl-tetrahydropterin synthase
VEIRAGVEQLNREGYSLDFESVHEELQAAVAGLDGSDLGAHAEIGSPTPSAENLALFVARVVGPRISRLGGTLLSVTIWEGSSNRVDLELEDRG